MMPYLFFQLGSVNELNRQSWHDCREVERQQQESLDPHCNRATVLRAISTERGRTKERGGEESCTDKHTYPHFHASQSNRLSSC